MGRLRHVAIAVKDPESAADFYEKTFGLKRVGETDSELAYGIYLSDGVVCIAFLRYKTDSAAGKDKGKDFIGIHHVGFWVDDLDASGQAIESNGGAFFMDLPIDSDSLYYEKKYRDPNGVVFDISHNGWVGARK